MSISVCIPVFNHVVSDLVNELERQLIDSGVDYEILLLDDGSKPEVKSINRTLASQHVRYFENEGNFGRSYSRNELGRQAKKNHLLFIDNDLEIHRKDYVSNYLNQINKEKDVVYGGIQYTDDNTDINSSLRHLYGREVESKKVNHFSSCNFLIKTALLLQIPFREQIKSYGHEDTVLAKDLRTAGYKIATIKNPVLSTDLTTNEEFIAKSLTAVDNLKRLESQGILTEADSALIATAKRLKSARLAGLTKRSLQRSRPSIMKNLLSSTPSLRKLSMLKLLHYLQD